MVCLWYIIIMAYQFKLQVPISEELNEKLKEKSQQVGFSSVNQVARLLLTSFVNGDLNLSFTNSDKNTNSDLEKIIAAGIAEYENTKTKTLDLSKSIHEQLQEK
jgi:hypothetical protein